MNEEQEFEKRLELFRNDVEGALQLLYSYFTIYKVLQEDENVLKYINETPTFWRTVLYSLQSSYFITLHRIFDHKSKYNINKLIDFAHQNIHVFSKSALKARRLKAGGNVREWINDFIERAYAPDDSDFKRLRAHIDRYRNIYRTNYVKIRNTIYAHKVLSTQKDIDAIFANTNIKEMEKLTVFLKKVQIALREQYNNGRKPILLPLRYSLNSIYKHQNTKGEIYPIQMQIVKETKLMLSMLNTDSFVPPLR